MLQLTCDFVQNWASLAVEKPAFLGSPDDQDYMLRRAATVTQQTLHVFDLDAKPPVCNIFSHLPSTYKVKVDIGGQHKTNSMKTAAWSPVLGKDPLPKQLLLSGLYARSSTAVMLKEGGSLHICSQHLDIATAAGLQYPSLRSQELSLTFGTADYVQDQLPGRKRKLTGGPRLPPQPAKQGRPSTKAGELSTHNRKRKLSLQVTSQICVATSCSAHKVVLRPNIMQVLTQPFY